MDRNQFLAGIATGEDIREKHEKGAAEMFANAQDHMDRDDQLAGETGEEDK